MGRPDDWLLEDACSRRGYPERYMLSAYRRNRTVQDDARRILRRCLLTRGESESAALLARGNDAAPTSAAGPAPPPMPCPCAWSPEQLLPSPEPVPLSASGTKNTGNSTHSGREVGREVPVHRHIASRRHPGHFHECCPPPVPTGSGFWCYPVNAGAAGWWGRRARLVVAPGL